MAPSCTWGSIAEEDHGAEFISKCILLLKSEALQLCDGMQNSLHRPIQGEQLLWAKPSSALGAGDNYGQDQDLAFIRFSFGSGRLIIHN